jgi:hypothetical protein
MKTQRVKLARRLSPRIDATDHAFGCDSCRPGGTRAPFSARNGTSATIIEGKHCRATCYGPFHLILLLPEDRPRVETDRVVNDHRALWPARILNQGAMELPLSAGRRIAELPVAAFVSLSQGT